MLPPKCTLGNPLFFDLSSFILFIIVSFMLLSLFIDHNKQILKNEVGLPAPSRSAVMVPSFTARGYPVSL